MKKKKKLVIICVICVLLAIPAGYMMRIRGSVRIKSQSDSTAGNTVYFMQKDPQWGAEHLGNSSYTMSSSGCLTSCIASDIQMQHISVPGLQEATNGDEKALTPGILNEFLSEQGVYDAEGNIQWVNLEQVLGVKIVKQQARELSDGELDTLLSEGIFPIVYVRVNGLGNFHFVLITGSKDGDFLCMDPLNKDQDEVPLSQFGDRIYAVRYFVEKNG